MAATALDSIENVLRGLRDLRDRIEMDRLTYPRQLSDGAYEKVAAALDCADSCVLRAIAFVRVERVKLTPADHEVAADGRA